MSIHSQNHYRNAAEGRKRIRFMIQVTMLCALQFVMMMIPFLGFIPLGFVNATTLHLPVIVAGSLLGVKGGAIVGLCFGLISMARSTLNPTLLSFLFSPFVPGGNVYSLIIAIVPRILLGVFAALIYAYLKDKNLKFAAAAVTGLLATLLHTVMVLGGIYLFFGEAYASAQGISLASVIPFLLGIVATNGIVEAVLALVVNTVLVRALAPIVHKEA